MEAGEELDITAAVRRIELSLNAMPFGGGAFSGIMPWSHGASLDRRVQVAADKIERLNGYLAGVSEEMERLRNAEMRRAHQKQLMRAFVLELFPPGWNEVDE